MGSGSSGGGGGGGGGGGSGGGGYGGYKYGGGGAKAVSKPMDAQKQAFQGVISKLAQEYLLSYFDNPLVRDAYRNLFLIGVDLNQNKAWDGIKERHGVDGGAGCLRALANKIVDQAGLAGVTSKAKADCRVAVEDFLMRAVGGRLSVFWKGNAADVLKNVDANAFKSTSGYFLGGLINKVMEREEQALPPDAKASLLTMSQSKADEIIHSFESRFKDVNQVSYRRLFDVIHDDPAWFVAQLRKKT